MYSNGMTEYRDAEKLHYLKRHINKRIETVRESIRAANKDADDFTATVSIAQLNELLELHYWLWYSEVR